MWCKENISAFIPSLITLLVMTHLKINLSSCPQNSILSIVLKYFGKSCISRINVFTLFHYLRLTAQESVEFGFPIAQKFGAVGLSRTNFLLYSLLLGAVKRKQTGRGRIVTLSSCKTSDFGPLGDANKINKCGNLN